MIVRENRSTPRKPVPMPLCPPQITYDLTRVRTRAPALGWLRQPPGGTARPFVFSLVFDPQDGGVTFLHNVGGRLFGVAPPKMASILFFLCTYFPVLKGQ
jgi:hypothetical protein